MKQFLLYLSVFIVPVLSYSQNDRDSLKLPFVEDRIVFELIDSLQLSQSSIHLKAKEWVAQYFKSAKAVIQLDEPEAGKLIVKGNTLVSGQGTYAPIEVMNFTIEVASKENKYRIRLKDISGYPQTMRLLEISLEDLYDRVKKNTYPSGKTKKQKAYMEEMRVKDKTTIVNIKSFITQLLGSFRDYVAKKDDF